MQSASTDSTQCNAPAGDATCHISQQSPNATCHMSPADSVTNASHKVNKPAVNVNEIDIQSSINSYCFHHVPH